MSRTIKILGAMVAGVTLVSGALLALEPGPAFRPSMSLSATEDAPLFATAPTRTDAHGAIAWKRIVILDSHGVEGGQAEVDAYFRRFPGYATTGVGTHFVVRKDGGERIEMCNRWRQQEAAAVYPAGSSANGDSIAICLVGNAENKPFDAEQLKELAWLVRQLQARYNIPAQMVDVRVGQTPRVMGTARARGTGGTFPLAAFKAALGQ